MSNTLADTYGILHCHTDYSVKDCPIKINDLCRKAKEMGAKAIAITDHGTCAGWIDFKECCEANNIQPILGIETYIKTRYAQHAHLILMAKNYKGYQEISHAISEANLNLVKIGNISFPVMDMALLKKYFGNGNVIATTACISGVAAQVFQHNKRTREQIEKLEKKKRSLHTNSLDIRNEELVQLDNEIAILAAKKEEYTILAKKTYTKRLKGLESLRLTDEHIYLQTKNKIEEEILESRHAQEHLDTIKKELAEKRGKRSVIKKAKKEAENILGKIEELQEKIDLLTGIMIPESEISKAAEEELMLLYTVFENDLYCEMQYHGLEEEKKIMPILAAIAKKNGIPLLAANDVHLLSAGQAKARQSLCALRFSNWEPISESDKELYPKTDTELRQALIKILPQDQVEESIKNIKTVCDQCKMEFPVENHYPKYRDDEGNPVEDSEALVRDLVTQNISKRYPDGLTDAEAERLDYELDTICSLGYADYFLIVADFIRYAKQAACENEYHIGYGVGPGRGSAVGSMVTYLLGITEIDPLKYGLIFERFLNKDRVSMPDIDTDFSDEVRDRVISYVTQKYSPKKAADVSNQYVTCIRTSITQGVKASIRNEARNYGYEKYPITDDMNPAEKKEAERKRRELTKIGDQICKDIPTEPQISFMTSDNSGTLLDSLLAAYRKSDERTIIQRAADVEKTTTGYSIHAAGIIISDGYPIQDYVPIMYNTSKRQWAVQCDMNEAERMHLLKMDFLGLKTLDIITETLRRIKKNTGKHIDIAAIPFETEIFREIFCKGKTTCVFQFESSGMKKMLKEFRPDTIEDLILLVAAYRPGPMEFIPEIIDVKNGRRKPRYAVPELERILSPTYGKPIYQEQLMDIFHSCAGFTLGEADIIRRYMSKKKVNKFLAYKDQFVDGLIKSGCTATDAITLWTSLEDFSKYAFNKSHAAVYAIVAYETAWLKYHYPTEYMCAVLNHTDAKKIPEKIYECKEMGIEILPPDINRSKIGFEDYRGNILFGLGAIKGVKKWAAPIIAERSRHGKYESLKDFFLRAHSNKGATEILIKAGVLDHYCADNRTALLNCVQQYSDVTKKIHEKEALIEALNEELEKCADASEKGKITRKIINAKKALSAKQEEFDEIRLSKDKDDKMKILSLEKKVLGYYVSGHPLDVYRKLYHNAENLCRISEVHTGYVTCAGLISNVSVKKRKADGKKMCFFLLEDMTGSIQVNCFADEYQKNSTRIAEGKVVKINGYIGEETGLHADDEVVYKLTVSSLTVCKPDLDPIFISVPDLENAKESLIENLLLYRDDEGYPAILHDQKTGHMEPLAFGIRKTVLQAVEFKEYFLKLIQE